jgi:hypothetical protein
MKFPISNFQFPICRRAAKTAASRRRLFGNWRLAIGNRKSRSGIALVITLIMLSVTLVMALAFLAVSSRERNAVSTTTDTATARLADDAALAAAQAQIAANILASTNVAAYSFNLLVSTNFISGAGFEPNNGFATNVNYNYANGNPVTGNDLLQNIANLWLLPRAPVFVLTNQQTGARDFRYYLDLNRNAADEGNGLQPVRGNTGGYLHQDGTESFNAADVLTNLMTGDPEWIGVLEHPDQPHGPNNHFIARYAFAAVPIGNTLDLNYIHNQAADRRVNPASGGQDGFMRNQGVGSWELNLAAFLTDLNTNSWDPITAPYLYREPTFFNNGIPFDDARALLSWRYNFAYNRLAPAIFLFPFLSANNVLPNDGIDTYADGPLQTTVNTNADFIPDAPGNFWAGANNPNHFYSLPSELFDPTKSSGGVGSFTNRLMNAGNGNSSYDRYTFYRMLDELGTDTVPEQSKLNLNYSNAVVNYSNGVVMGVTIVPGAETNLVPWTAQDFFNAAADSMLKLYTTNWYASDPTNFLLTYYGGIPPNTPYIGPNGFGLTNFPYLGMTNEVPAFGISHIPVYTWNNYLGRYVFAYTPAVNRVLQLAANIYDAATNTAAMEGGNYPSVFRPVFERNVDDNVFIVGYTNLMHGGVPNTVGGTTDPQLSLPLDISSLTTMGTINNPIYTNGASVNVYGVPWIIGAKKGFPALNQFSMVNAAQFTRKLQVVRDHIGPGANIWTNQMVVMSITNNIGISFWNSYANDYPTNYGGPGLNLYISVHSEVQSVVTNSDWGTPFFLPRAVANYLYHPYRWPGSKWAAFGGGAPDPQSFFAWQWTNTVVPQSVYNFTTKTFNNSATATYFWETNLHDLYPLPQLGLMTTNWLQAYIVDGSHVIDYVQLRGPINNGNLNSGLNDPGPGGPPNDYLWVTNVFGSGSATSWGIVDQMTISSSPAKPPAFARWNKLSPRIPGISDPQLAARVFFAAILSPDSVYQYKTDAGSLAYYTNFELAVQAPYTATRMVYVPYLYQVNDPLVHYTVNDLDAGNAGVWAGNNVQKNGIWGHIDDATTSPFPVPPTTDIVKGRYQPWGKIAPTTFQTSAYNFDNPYNLVYKDPLVWGSDYWDFPTNKYPTVGWIGRVHRGTPWQTVYLKAHNVLHSFFNASKTIFSGTNTWAAWTGDYNLSDAANSGPLQDRMLFDLFTTSPNENATRGQLSVNQTHLAAWSALFSGMVALTNSFFLPSFLPPNSSFQTSNSWLVIQPAGVGGVNSDLGKLVANINNSRAIYTNLDGVVGTFEHKGDILSAALLTEYSPFLNTNQLNYGISDAVYEWLPQQMMSLLTCPTAPRYLVYCYGQTLKPAQDAIVTSSTALAGGGTAFGLVTNYQVVAESAARAVIRMDRHVSATGTNFTTTVESYNPLPPN